MSSWNVFAASGSLPSTVFYTGLFPVAVEPCMLVTDTLTADVHRYVKCLSSRRQLAAASKIL